MRVNRRLLSWGIFLLALGGVLVAADLRTIDTALLTDLVRLWPLALLAIGFAIVLRRTRLGLALVLAGALIPGLVLGAAFAVVPRFAGDCGARGEPQAAAVAEGTFTGRANVTVRTGCGSLAVSTAPGDGWRLDARNTTGRAPIVESAPNGLEVRPRGDGGDFLDRGRDAWDLTLPATRISRLSIESIAGDGRIALPGARLDRLVVTANASSIVVDASGASLRDLSGTVNVGALSISLPDDGIASGSLRVGGGALQLCVAESAGVDIAIRGTAEAVTVGGEAWDGSSWPRSGREPSASPATLDIHITFGALEINPIGGCS